MTDEQVSKFYGTSQQNISHMRKNNPKKYKCALFGAIVQNFGVEDKEELHKILDLYTYQKQKQTQKMQSV